MEEKLKDNKIITIIFIIVIVFIINVKNLPKKL